MLHRMRPYTSLKAEMMLGAVGAFHECCMAHWFALSLLLLADGSDVDHAIQLGHTLTSITWVEAACAPGVGPSCIISF
jgi:hypothetical protein